MAPVKRRRYSSPASPTKSPTRGRSRIRSDVPQRSRSLAMAVRPARGKGKSRSAYVRKNKKMAKASRATFVNTMKSGGFFQGSSRILAKRRKLASNLGVNYTHEYGGGITAALAKSSIIVGHQTCPTEKLAVTMFAAMIKRLLLKCGICPSDIDGTILNRNFIVKLQYKENSRTPTVKSKDSTTTTINSIATEFRQFFFDSGSIGVTINQIKLISISIEVETSAGEPFLRLGRIPLRNAKIDINCKSDLKIQNVTLSGTSSNVDVVDNSPLYGKFYEGKGSGTTTIQDGTPNPAVFGLQMHDIMIDGRSGALCTVEGNQKMYLDPPPGCYFPEVKKMGKAHIEASNIKTSTIYYSKQVYVNSLLRQLLGTKRDAPVNSAGGEGLIGSYQHHRVGYFRFFILERMINSSGTDATPAIDWEHNLKIDAFLIPGKEQYTTNLFESVTDYNTPTIVPLA